ncbi:helix-turn-helix domain-containing protein [Streptomyces sp. ICBB 8177]|uniref:ArsR/SmtB family transcription factor n=1 Tax=Streptomyces sp. ICBB 8177 TaxID=563922 RepID=UPI000D6840D1|nr:helix-turn-helix domain-containing protein [Streptomyces sp. ICBB 8177]PWI44878.1 hypothetical protein CK485_06685 [Streptomyces sp. ICBB 8177]
MPYPHRKRTDRDGACRGGDGTPVGDRGGTGSRAAVLEATADGTLTTGQVARRVGSSEPNVSEHLRTLREAELVVSFRDGGTVRHSLSRLGWALLEGRPARL